MEVQQKQLHQISHQIHQSFEQKQPSHNAASKNQKNLTIHSQIISSSPQPKKQQHDRENENGRLTKVTNQIEPNQNGGAKIEVVQHFPQSQRNISQVEVQRDVKNKDKQQKYGQYQAFSQQPSQKLASIKPTEDLKVDYNPQQLHPLLNNPRKDKLKSHKKKKNKQIKLQDLQLDLNNPADRAIQFAFKWSQIYKDKEKNLRNMQAFNESKIKKSMRLENRVIGRIKSNAFSQSLQASRISKIEDIEESRAGRIGKIIRVKGSLEKQLHNPFDYDESPKYSPKRQYNIGRIVKIAKNNEYWHSFESKKCDYEASSIFNSPLTPKLNEKHSNSHQEANKRKSPMNLPPLPKLNHIPNANKNSYKKQKQREVLILQKYQRINEMNQLKKFMASIIYSICDEAIARVEQKRAFFSYRVKKYIKKSPSQKNVQYAQKMGDKIFPKSSKLNESIQGMYFNTLSVSKTKRQDSVKGDKNRVSNEKFNSQNNQEFQETKEKQNSREDSKSSNSSQQNEHSSDDQSSNSQHSSDNEKSSSSSPNNSKSDSNESENEKSEQSKQLAESKENRKMAKKL